MKKNALIIVATAIFSVAALAQNAPVERITDGPRVKQTTRNSAEIAWSTDAAGSSVVRYGINPHRLSRTAQKPWGGTHEPNGDFNHTVWVKNLRPDTTYYFLVETGQARGTGTGARSEVQEFHTAGQ
jgi:hypothetical protein